MLVLSRKLNESIVVGGSSRVERQITVTVLEIRGARVKLGFDAAPGVRVQRSEMGATIAGGQPASAPVVPASSKAR